MNFDGRYHGLDKSMGESNTVVSADTLYRHLQQYCSHLSIYQAEFCIGNYRQEFQPISDNQPQIDMSTLNLRHHGKKKKNDNAFICWKSTVQQKISVWRSADNGNVL